MWSRSITSWWGPAAPAERWPDSPPWSNGARLWVLTFIVLAGLFVWWQVRQFTGLVILACLYLFARYLKKSRILVSD